ncbi:MAG: hypothetical protein ACXVFK_02685 [Solirubrobacteraceae bacterium]
MEGSARIGRRTLVVSATLAALGLGACGGQRQDAKEPSGTFRVAVVRSSFPAKQHLARSERMVISVKNTGNKTVPDLAVTVDSFSAKSEQPDLADPSRAVWIIDKSPHGGDTAYVNTWALGRLRPGQTRRFVWQVTAVKPGTHTVKWRVAVGLNGKAQARSRGDQVPQGQFTVDVSDKPSQSRVDPSSGQIIRSN